MTGEGKQIYFVMNWLTIILFSLFVLPFSAEGQSKPAARSLGVEPEPNCEIEKAYLALFRSELEKDPTASGIIVINGDPYSMRGNVIFESSVKNYLKEIETDPDRYEVVRSKSQNRTTWEMWIVPAGADSPKIERSAWSYKAEPGSRPYQFTWENIFDDDICPQLDDVQLFTEFLKANPTAHGNIVIRGKRARTIKETRTRVLTTLTRTYSVPKSRLRFFIASEIPTGLKPRVEYWFVP